MADEDERPAVTDAGAGRRKERESREAAALRANLLKRKAQQRGRGDAAATRPGKARAELAVDAPDGGRGREGDS